MKEISLLLELNKKLQLELLQELKYIYLDTKL